MVPQKSARTRLVEDDHVIQQLTTGAVHEALSFHLAMGVESRCASVPCQDAYSTVTPSEGSSRGIAGYALVPSSNPMPVASS